MSEFTVFPQLGDRGYKREGKVITIYRFHLNDSAYMEPELTDDVLGAFELPTEDMARHVMNDLYYGEYNGG